jgi:hypothetical protein
MNTLIENKFYSAFSNNEEANRALTAIEELFEAKGLDIENDIAAVKVGLALAAFDTNYAGFKSTMRNLFPLVYWHKFDDTMKICIDLSNPYGRTVTDITN